MFEWKLFFSEIRFSKQTKEFQSKMFFKINCSKISVFLKQLIKIYSIIYHFIKIVVQNMCFSIFPSVGEGFAYFWLQIRTHHTRLCTYYGSNATAGEKNPAHQPHSCLAGSKVFQRIDNENETLFDWCPFSFFFG